MSYIPPYSQGLLVFNSNPFYAGYSNVSDVKNNNVLVRQLGTVDTIVSNVTATQVHGNTVQLLGYYNQNDNGGSTIVWNATSTAIDDNATVFKPSNITGAGRWIRQFNNGIANVRMWGTKEDGSSDDVPAIQNAINYCSLSGVPNLYFNSNTYFLSSFGIPWYDQNGNYNSVYEPAYLGLGNYPNTNNKVNINLYGNGATLYTNNFTFVNGVSGIRSSIFTIVENLSTCTINGFTLKNTGYLCGYQGNSGISIRGNKGGSFSWGINSPYAINRDTINISNNTFIDCHRAINSQSSYIAGSGTKTLNIIGNKFLYPNGSNSTNNGGGGQLVYIYPDTQNLNVINNFAEGTSTVPVNSPNNYSKDGFIFYAGIVNKIANNTLARFGVETFALDQNWDSFYLSTYGTGGYFGDTTPIINNIPAVGQSITLSSIWISANTWQQVDSLTATNGFNIGSYVVWTGGKYTINGNTDNTNDAGIYQITSYPYRGWTNYGATTAISVRMTRVSGVDTYPYNVLANTRTNTTGINVTGGILTPFNRSNTFGASSIVIDNVFTIGLAASTANLQYLAHNPAVRAETGQIYLSGNKIYGAGLMPFTTVAEPRSNWLIEKNDFYLYNEKPILPVGFTHYTDGVGGVMCLGAVVRNNNLHFWVDINGNTATTVNSAVPELYTNNPPDYQPTYYSGFGVNYAYWGWNQTPPLTGQTFINNICYCSVPSMSGMIIPISQAASISKAVNGLDPNSNVYNFVSGNNIVFGP